MAKVGRTIKEAMELEAKASERLGITIIVCTLGIFFILLVLKIYGGQ